MKQLTVLVVNDARVYTKSRWMRIWSRDCSCSGPKFSAEWSKKFSRVVQRFQTSQFGCEDKDAKVVTLVKASDTAIVRHTKIRSDANPFDPY